MVFAAWAAVLGVSSPLAVARRLSELLKSFVSLISSWDIYLRKTYTSEGLWARLPAIAVPLRTLVQRSTILVSVVSTRVAKLRATDLCLPIESNRMHLPDVTRTSIGPDGAAIGVLGTGRARLAAELLASVVVAFVDAVVGVALCLAVVDVLVGSHYGDISK